MYNNSGFDFESEDCFMRREDNLSHTIKQDTKEALSRINSVRAFGSTLIFSIVDSLLILFTNLAKGYVKNTLGMSVLFGVFIVINLAMAGYGFYLLKNHEKDKLNIYYRAVLVFNALTLLIPMGIDMNRSKSVLITAGAAAYMALTPCFKRSERRFYLYGYGIAFVITAIISGGGIRVVTEAAAMGLLTVIMGNAFQDKEIEFERMSVKLKDKTITSEKDALTGLSNRRGLDRKVSVLWPFCARNNGNVGVIEIDIDFFKKYNDKFGHPAGDRCLKQIAQIIQDSAVRGTDIVARTGGEEFMVFVHEMNEEEIVQLALKIRSAIDEACIPHAYYGVSKYVTVSMGVAIINPGMSNSFAELYEEADRALYEAKNSGRHCVAYNGKIYGRMRNGLAVVND